MPVEPRKSANKDSVSSSAAICQPGVDLQCPCTHRCLSLPGWEVTSCVFLFWDMLMVLGQETSLQQMVTLKHLTAFAYSTVFLSGIFFPLHSDLNVPPKEKFAWRHLKSPHATHHNCRNTVEQEPHSKTSNLVKPKRTSLHCLPRVTLHGRSALLIVLVLPHSPLFNHAKNLRVSI